MILNTLIVTAASFFFSVLFNIRKENLIYAALGGGLGYLVYETLTLLSMSHNTSLFLASISFATYSEVMARIRKTTDTTFAISALIPLVPGKGMYLTMMAIINNEPALALNTGLATLTDATLLAVGIIFVSTIVKLTRNARIT